MNKQIGIIGLGKMGYSLALNLKDKGWDVVVFNRSQSKVEEIEKQGITGAKTLTEFIGKLKGPRVVWCMLTAGEATQDIIFKEGGLKDLLSEGDFIIEGGNSKFTQDKSNAQLLAEKGINYTDVGVSGGPNGARNGACLMIGGTKNNFETLETLYKDIAYNGTAYKFFEGYGAGHFVKMVHNGIEYGMMQSIAEGFSLIKQSEFDLNLVQVAEIYNNRSVIESRLIEWLKDGFIKYGENLDVISGSVQMLGEGEWTVETAKAMNLQVKVIENSVEFRKQSQSSPSFTGKILSMLRNMFGGHSIEN